ncbi:MAG: MBL fold metallo-hydrolase, partial [Acetobacteraceae bacterium]|nr:MBL fold metallo-hydrolase [Acetobacteraceae bacterium]
MKNAPTAQIPGVYHRRVGDIIVTAISDGFLDGNLDVLRNISEDEARQILT